MLKLYIALCLALVVGTLTLTNGILYDARLTTIIYRVLISIVLFAVIGYILGVVVEKNYKELVAENITQEETEPIISEQERDETVVSESEFSPFASDSFEQISRPKE